MRKPKLLLVSPYKKGTIRIGQYLSPSIGVYRIASFLRKKRICQADVVDPDIDGEEYVLEKVKDGYDIIGMSMLYPTLKNDLALAEKIHKISAHSLIIAGGQGAVFSSEFILHHFPVDIVAKGLGEYAMEKIVNAYPERRFSSIPSLAIKTPRGIVHTRNSETYSYEDYRQACLSFDFDMVPYEIYWRIMESHYTKEHLSMMKNENMVRTIRINTASHCNRGCTFCSSTNYFKEGVCRQDVIFLSAEDIMVLMRDALAAHPGTTSFFFTDDNFLQDRARIVRLCSLLESENLFSSLTLFCLARTDSVDEKLLLTMRSAGFKFIIYGVESFSNRTLCHMNKMIAGADQRSHQIKMIKKTLECGITPLFNIILFFPTADVDDILKTIDGSLEMVKAGARLTVYSYVEVYPGSSILRDTCHEYIYSDFCTTNHELRIQKFILPRDAKVRKLAEDALKLRDKVILNLNRTYNWSVIPHPLYGLTLFWAIYHILDLDCSRIDSAVSQIIKESDGRSKNACKIKEVLQI
jgi:radical SAM superfamily enzyme YgiQ (UPF0313 family)